MSAPESSDTWLLLIHQMGIQDTVFERHTLPSMSIFFYKMSQYVVPFLHIYLVIIRTPRIAFRIPRSSNLYLPRNALTTPAACRYPSMAQAFL